MAPAGSSAWACALSMHDEVSAGGLPQKRELPASQAAVAQEREAVTTEFVLATRDHGGVYWVPYFEWRVLWVPNGTHELYVRLRVCAHMGEAGYRGVEAMPGWLDRLRRYCIWKTMEAYAKEFIRQCLYYAHYNTGATVPRPLASTVHLKRAGNMVHFDFWHIEEIKSCVCGGYTRWLQLLRALLLGSWCSGARFWDTACVGERQRDPFQEPRPAQGSDDVGNISFRRCGLRVATRVSITAGICVV